ncbi:hypothetical protein NM208_g997 [Fusarium decemcellulare]|uniref:Uncharacterized protein n=1 Tax=Fusarium decemcellulare TaxID=57161 RepID=A0ACC1SXN1_9HYPO|nr:hypothetical protein NM208_g997 [Fusarium decemcellulare]
MTLLLDYPQEIIDSILQWVTPKDLYTLCLVNKPFCAIAQPRLYVRIEWEWSVKVPPVDFLLRSLLEKPALGDWAQAVILKGTDRIATAMDAYIACLLAMLPNLRDLRLEPIFAYRSKLSSKMFRAALSVFPRQSRPKLPQFEHLRHVAHLRRIASTPGDKPKGASSLTPFFYLPEVHSLSASVENTPHWRWPEHKPELETLTTLNLASLQAKHLGTILSETRNLKSLQWDWRGWPKSYFRPNEIHWINLDEIMVALQHVQKTLVELKISGSCRYDGKSRPQLRVNGSLKGLAAFEMLKTAELPLAFLAGLVAHNPPHLPASIYESLPATITHVALSDDFNRAGDWRGSSQLEVFALWMDNVKTSTPRLQRLEWIPMMAETVREWHDNPGLKSGLLATCGGAAVDVEIVERVDNQKKGVLMWE